MKTYLETEETEQLENTATCLRDKLLIRLLARLGCRISEALALQVGDIDFARRMVTIEHLKSRVKFTCPSCNAGLRLLQEHLGHASFNTHCQVPKDCR